jgi:starch phosphorylase
MTHKYFRLQVLPDLPAKISRLHELAENFWFSWHRPTRQLFFLLDHDLWWRAGRNPKVFLRCIDQSLLELAAENETFMAAYRKVLAEFDAYLEQSVGRYKPAALGKTDLIAYFCAEYGYHESFPNYSGGLGILAGDHCKTASDMRIPFVAVGLLYRRGYFTQRIDRNGEQIAAYVDTPADDTPVRPLLGDSGQPVVVSCRLKGRPVAIKVWQANVGRISVLLLDTDLEENHAEDREITRVLYGGGELCRLQQEIVLGIGGVRALRAAGMQPAVWHINEGHAAFLALERARELVSGGLPFSAALESVASNVVFTTHTPVAAGHDTFPTELIRDYFNEFWGELGITEADFMALGLDHDAGQRFNMTHLAISSSRAVNGVSRIHRTTSAAICASAWPEIPAAENPMGFVTNGVHVPTFIEQDWADLFEQHLGPAWRSHITDHREVEKILDIPDGRFWYVNQRVKSNMFTSLRIRLEHQYSRNNVSDAHIRRHLRYLDPNNPNVLTIGFARRFATYKRATLLFSDLDWLRRIVNDEHPVVFIFAGKAHPADEPGQQLLREVHRISNMPEFVGKVLLVEGYDMGLGRLLTAGVDVWLNTPIYPMEASGTSGMKAAINGTINLSVLDGWWAEAFDGANGWPIPPSDEQDPGERDRQDARTLYETLQDEVLPLFYARDQSLGLSPGWVERCKRSMVSVLPHFNSDRVMHDYATMFYGPAVQRGRRAAADNHAVARDLAEWKNKIRREWPAVRLSLASEPNSRTHVRATVPLTVEVHLGGLQPQDLRVECVLHRELCSNHTVPVPRFASDARIADGSHHIDDELAFIAPLAVVEESVAVDKCRFHLDLQAPWAGVLGYEIRAVPTHPELSHAYEMGLMRWL